MIIFHNNILGRITDFATCCANGNHDLFWNVSQIFLTRTKLRCESWFCCYISL